jgi:hypothetical protein
MRNIDPPDPEFMDDGDYDNEAFDFDDEIEQIYDLSDSPGRHSSKDEFDLLDRAIEEAEREEEAAIQPNNENSAQIDNQKRSEGEQSTPLRRNGNGHSASTISKQFDGEFESSEEDKLPGLEQDFVSTGLHHTDASERRSSYNRRRAARGGPDDFIRQTTKLAYQLSSQAAPGVFAGEPGLPFAMDRWLDPLINSASLLEDARLMEGLAAAAAGAPNENIAAEYASAMVLVALRLAPGYSRGLWPAIPGLIAGASGLARIFYRQASAAVLMGRLPVILTAAVAALTMHLGRRQQLTQRVVAEVFARQVTKLLSDNSQTGQVE